MYRLALSLFLVSSVWYISMIAVAEGENSAQNIPAIREEWQYFAIVDKASGNVNGIVGGDYAPATDDVYEGVRKDETILNPIEPEEGVGVIEVSGNPELQQVIADVDGYTFDEATSEFAPKPGYEPKQSTNVTDSALPSVMFAIPAILGVVLAGGNLTYRRFHQKP